MPSSSTTIGPLPALLPPVGGSGHWRAPGRSASSPHTLACQDRSSRPVRPRPSSWHSYCPVGHLTEKGGLMGSPRVVRRVIFAGINRAKASLADNGLGGRQVSLAES